MALDFSLANSGSPLAAALAGRQRLRTNRARDLLQQAAQNPEQRGQLLSQALALAPRAAATAQDFYQKQAAQEHDIHLRRLRKFHALLEGFGRTSSVANTKGDAGIGMMDAYFQQVRPDMVNLVGELGGDPSKIPLHYDKRMMPFIKAGLAKTSVAFQNQMQNVPAGIRTANHWMQWLLYGTPEQKKAAAVHLGLARRQSSAAIQYKDVQLPNGATQVLAFDPNSPMGTRPKLVGSFDQGGNWQPNPSYGASPQGDGNVTFDFAPGTPPEVIAAAKAAARANGDLGPSRTPVRRLGPGQSTFAKSLSQALGKGAGETQTLIDQGPIKRDQARKQALTDQQVKMLPKARAALAGMRTMKVDGDAVIAKVNALRNSPGLKSLTGWKGVAASVFPPGSAARDAAIRYKNLLAILQEGYLLHLRSMTTTGGSPTGSNTSDYEQRLMRDASSILRPTQSPEQQKAALDSIVQMILDRRKAAKGAFEQRFAPILVNGKLISAPRALPSARTNRRTNSESNNRSPQSNSQMDAATAAKVKALLNGK